MPTSWTPTGYGLVRLHNDRIALDYIPNNEVWITLNFDQHGANNWRMVDADLMAGTVQAILDYWTVRRNQNYAERLIVAYATRDDFTLWHAVSGANPNKRY